MVKKLINYQNIAENVRREQEEVVANQVAERDFGAVEQVLQAKYQLKRPPFIREAVSTTKTDAALAMTIRGKVALHNPLKIPSKSAIYRAGLQALSQLSAAAIAQLINNLQ